MDEETIMVGKFFLVFLFGGLLFGGIFYFIGQRNVAEELGQSICEEEYGMDYKNYYDDVLTCKPIAESYDGIKIITTGGG